eukprot:3868028-Amphidinium_carterae.1
MKRLVAAVQLCWCSVPGRAASFLPPPRVQLFVRPFASDTSAKCGWSSKLASLGELPLHSSQGNLKHLRWRPIEALLVFCRLHTSSDLNAAANHC